MRIGLFTDFYLEDNFIAHSVRLVRRIYEKAGHKVYVFTAANRQKARANKEEGVFTFTSAHFKQYPQFRLSLSPFLSAKKIVSGLNIDAIHNFAVATMGLAAATCARDLEIPSVATVTSVLHLSEGKGEGKLAHLFKDMAVKYARWFYAFFDEVAFPTSFAKEAMKDVIKGSSSSSIVPLPIQEPALENAKPKYIGYVGSSKKASELDILLSRKDSIANRFGKEVKVFSINGNSSYADVKEAEKLPFAERISAYRKLQLFVDVPSYEAFPFPTLEYMFAGNPVVAAEHSPSSEFVGELDKALLYKDGSTLMDALAYGLEHRKELKEKAKELASTYNERVEGLYLSLLDKLGSKS